MKIIQGFNNINKIPKGSICSIGIFDGIHLGHLAILNELVKKAKRENKPSLIITFHPHPSKLLTPTKEVLLLISLKHRLLLLEKLGIDYCFLIHFDKKIAQISPIDFVEKILSKKLRIEKLYLGDNFHFGKDQKGNVDLLRDLSRKFNFNLEITPPVKYRNKIISSTWIRKELRSGNLNLVSKLLGRPYSIYGRVIEGRGKGRVIGFPTANLDIEHEALPPCGVYLTKSYIEKETYLSLLYIGHRPTFGKRVSLSVEVYLIDFKNNLYGKFIEVEFVKKIRPEKKFHSISSLISAIKKDELFARQFSQCFLK